MFESASPRVSVVTAIYNGARFLPAAIESVLNQSYANFEYVIVDDASSDRSYGIAAQYAARDPRIRPILNSANKGPAGALNRAIEAARGDFVAVLDHDDLALPERLAHQVSFLDAHPEVGAVGAQACIIDEENAAVGQWRYPTHPAEARWQLLFGATLLHSASMYRRSLLQQLGGYSEEHPYLCDYELLVRMAEICQLANLSEQLVCYRRSATQLSSTHTAPQNRQMLLLQYAVQLRWLGLRPDLAVFPALLNWGRGALAASESLACAAMNWLSSLFSRYCETIVQSDDDRAVVTRSCARRWLVMAHHAYTTLRPLSRECWNTATRLDPKIVQCRNSLATLRRQRRRLKRAKLPLPSLLSRNQSESGPHVLPPSIS